MRERAAGELAGAADVAIGDVLAHTPPGEDGVWPAPALQRLLEELRSRDLEDGLQTGRLNQRGVTTRGPYDGGGQERSAVADLRAHAQQLTAQAPRGARLLRDIAASLESQARQFARDARASEDAG